MKLVKGDYYTEQRCNKMLELLRSYVGKTEISVLFVDNIPLERTEKRKAVLSEISLDFQATSP